MTVADVYVVISSLNNILMFSCISNLKKRKAEPLVVSDSSDTCVFYELFYLFIYMLF